jgi:CRP-like cAMP-binding protein
LTIVEVAMPTRPLLKKLLTDTALDSEDEAAIATLPMTIKETPARATLAREGSTPTHCCVLLEGLACRSKTTDTGKRQILSVHIPGEILDLEALHLRVLDHDVATLSKCRVGLISHEALLAVTRARPMVAEALWRYTARDAAVFREWIVNIGRRPALNRLAHFLVEVGTRLEKVGLANDASFELPMTQLDIADALGLTPVHVNRVVQELRRSGLLELHKYTVALPDLKRLKEVAAFDDLYLRQPAAI